MNEIQIEILQTNAQITDNFEEVKNYLSAQLEEYRTATFNDDGIKMAKATVASLRKQQTAVKDRIKDVKMTYMRPFEEFKAKADELVELYNEPINFINDQVQDYVERQKQEKRELIKTLYSEYFSDIPEHTLESIYNERWENATYKPAEINKDLAELHEKILQEEQLIQQYRSDAVEEAMRLYRKNRNLADAIAYITRYENQRQQILAKEAEAQRQRELEEARRQEREKMEAERKAEEEKAKAVEKAKQETIEAYIPEDDGTQEEEFIYNIKLTQSQREALEIYMDSIGLEWEVLNG